MANKKRGEFPITFDGEEMSVRFTVNAIADVEDHFDKSISDLFDTDKQPRIGVIRYLIWAGLCGAGHSITLEEVGDRLNLSDLKDLTQDIGKALNASLVGDEGNPQQPAAPKKARAEK